MRIEIEVRGGNLRHDRPETAEVMHQERKENKKSKQDEDHLVQVRHRVGPHAAQIGVQNDDGGGDKNGRHYGQTGERMQDNAEGQKLPGDPAQVDGNVKNAQCRREFLAVTVLKEVYNGLGLQTCERPWRRRGRQG